MIFVSKSANRRERQKTICARSPPYACVQWFEDFGYSADVAELSKTVPMTSFEAWLRENGFETMYGVKGAV